MKFYGDTDFKSNWQKRKLIGKSSIVETYLIKNRIIMYCSSQRKREMEAMAEMKWTEKSCIG